MHDKAYNDFFKNDLKGSVSKCYWHINGIEETISISPFTFTKSIIEITSEQLKHLSQTQDIENSSPVCFDDYLNKKQYIAEPDKDEIKLLKDIGATIEKIKLSEELTENDLKTLKQSTGIFNFCKTVILDKLDAAKISPKFIDDGFDRCEKSYKELIGNFVEVQTNSASRG